MILIHSSIMMMTIGDGSEIGSKIESVGGRRAVVGDLFYCVEVSYSLLL